MNRHEKIQGSTSGVRIPMKNKQNSVYHHPPKTNLFDGCHIGGCIRHPTNHISTLRLLNMYQQVTVHFDGHVFFGSASSLWLSFLGWFKGDL